jgi:hypothetical protein
VRPFLWARCSIWAYLPLFVGFGLFVLGLLGWYKKRIDKRRFEVAEQVLVTFNRLHLPSSKLANDTNGGRWWSTRAADRATRKGTTPTLFAPPKTLVTKPVRAREVTPHVSPECPQWKQHPDAFS